MYSRQQFWIYDRLVHISLQNFAKRFTASQESELLVQAHLLGSAADELENDQYVESYGVRAIWYFVTAILSIKKSNVTFDDEKSTPFETAIKHLEEALKCKFGKNDEEGKSFRKYLETLKSETLIHAIGAVLSNKTEARRLFNLHRDSLTTFQKDSMKCVLFSLQDFDKTFGSFSDFVKRIEIIVQKMLNIIHDTFIVKIAKNCCERLDVKGVDYGKMFENLDSSSDISSNERESNSNFDENSVVASENEEIKQNDVELHVSSGDKLHGRIPNSDANLSPIKMNDKADSFSPPKTEGTSIHNKVTSTPISKKKQYTFKKPLLKTNLPVISSASKNFTPSRASSSVRSYSSRQKHQFTPLQDAYIIMGKQKFNTEKGGWKKMLDHFPFPDYRTGTHLKDRWRTLLSKGEVKIENNEIKLSEKYTTLINYFASKFATNGHHKPVKTSQNSIKTRKKNSSHSHVSSPRLDYLSTDDLSDTETEMSGKVPGFNNVEKWIKTGQKESNKPKKIPPLLPERPKQNQELHKNYAKSPKREDSHKYQLVKNSSGKYFQKKGTDQKLESDIPCTSKKLIFENGIGKNTSVIAEVTVTSVTTPSQQTKVREKSEQLSTFLNSSKSQKKDNENTAKIPFEKNLNVKTNMPSSSQNEIGKSKNNATLVDEDVTGKVTDSTESTDTANKNERDNLKLMASVMSETENSDKSGVANKAIDSQRSVKSSHTSTSTFIDPDFACKDSCDNSSPTLITENHVTEEILPKNLEANTESGKDTILHPVDDDAESVGHLVIDESSTDSEGKDSIIEESFCKLEDQCSQNQSSDPLRLHLSVMSSQKSNPTIDATNAKNSEPDLEDDAEVTITAEQNHADEPENTKTNGIKSQVEPSCDKPSPNAAESSTTSQSNTLSDNALFPQSSLSPARSTTSASSEAYFTAHEDAISITSVGSSHGNGLAEEDDKTIVNDTLIQETPNIVEKWVHQNSDTGTQNGESQISAFSADTLDLLDQLDFDDESQASSNTTSKSRIKVEPSSKCIDGMFNNVINSQPDTHTLLDIISNAPSQSFCDEAEHEQNDVIDSRPKKRIKTEYIAARTRNAIKKENSYNMLEPPPNEMIVRNINTSFIDKTPVLKLNKVEIEPGVFSTNVCMFVEMSGSDVVSLTKVSNDSDVDENESDNGSVKRNNGGTNMTSVDLLGKSSVENESDVLCEVEQSTATKPDNILSEINSNDAIAPTKTKPIGDGDAFSASSNAIAVDGNEPSVTNVPRAKKYNWVTVKMPTRKRKVVLQDNGAPVKLSKADEALFSGGNVATKKSETIFSTIGKNRQGRRKAWSQEEDDNLLMGVKLFGEGNWRDVLNKFQFKNRTAINLKDRYRILSKKT